MNALLKIALMPLLILVGAWCLFEIMNYNKTEPQPEQSLTWQYDGNANGHELSTNDKPVVGSLAVAKQSKDTHLNGRLSDLTANNESSTFVSTQPTQPEAKPLPPVDGHDSESNEDEMDGLSLEPPQTLAADAVKPAKALSTANSKPQLRSLPAIPGTEEPLPPKVRLLPTTNNFTAEHAAPATSETPQPDVTSQGFKPQPKSKLVQNPHFGSSPRDDSLAASSTKAVETFTPIKEEEPLELPQMEVEETPQETSGGAFKPVQIAAAPSTSETRFGTFKSNDKPQPAPRTTKSEELKLPSAVAVQAPSTPTLTPPKPTQRPEIAVAPRTQMKPSSPIVERRASERIAYGKSLARRGSVFSARQEFTQALRMLAEAHDVSSQSRKHTSRLAAGLRALREAEDFVAGDTRDQLAMDVPMIVDAHATKLIDAYEATIVSPIEAMQRYYDFSAREMAAAIGNSPIGADALQSLGKLLMTSQDGNAMDQTKAMVMLQAAMLVNPNNYKSSNELGVLMAQNGRMEKATDLFKQSLKVKTSPEAWQNLARAHEELAKIARSQKARDEQLRLSQLASREAQLMIAKVGSSSTQGQMEWVEQNEFNEKAAIAAVKDQPTIRTAKAVNGEVGKKSEPKRKGILRNVKKWF